MNAIELVEKIILNRRTVKFTQMTGEKIDDNIIQKLLQYADAAPNHGKTEPWRMNVYSGESFKKLNEDHANLYWENTPEETRNPNTKSSIENYHTKASHVIVVWMRRTPETKIPEFEELAATAAAIQNILLGAEAYDLAAFWNTGAMVIKESMKNYLGLKSDDLVMGFIYLGIKDETVVPTPAERRIPLKEKVTWFV